MPSRNENNRNQEMHLIPCDNEDLSIHDVKGNYEENMFSNLVPGCNPIQILMVAASNNIAVTATFVQNEAILVEKRVHAFDQFKFRQVDKSSHLASEMLRNQARNVDDSVEESSKRSLQEDNNSAEPSLKRRLLQSRRDGVILEIDNPADAESAEPNFKVMKKEGLFSRVTNEAMTFHETEAVRESILIQADRLKRMSILMRHLEYVQNKLVEECLCIRAAQQI